MQLVIMERLFRWLGKGILATAIPALAIGALLATLVVWQPQNTDQQATNDVWTCSMHPQVRLARPGRCPICEMPLIPVSQLSAEQAALERLASLETEPVVY
jgi:membrane fusion protein, copper/silver efflux system